MTNFRGSFARQQCDFARDAQDDPDIVDFLGLTDDPQDRDSEQARTVT